MLSPYVPNAEYNESDFSSLIRHEMRWMCTLRVLRPRCFPFLFFSFSLPLAFLGVVFATCTQSSGTFEWMLFGIVVAERLALYRSCHFRNDRRDLSDLWLVPLRDLLLCWVWSRSLFASHIFWRGHKFDLDAHGLIYPRS